MKKAKKMMAAVGVGAAMGLAALPGVATAVSIPGVPVPVEGLGEAAGAAESALGQAGNALEGTGVPGARDLGSMAHLGEATVGAQGTSGQVHGGKNIVSFGDSYFADAAGVGSGGKCGQNPDNPPNLMGREMGLPVDDYSCSGATAMDAGGNSFGDQVGLALEHGTLSPETQYVAISMGGNDGMAGTPTPQAVQLESYRTAMAENINKIREAAPNAEILQVGYPEIVGSDNKFCPVHTSVNRQLEIPGTVIKAQEHTINTHQQIVADELGITFLDLKGSTAGHGTCADDVNRWVSGYADTSNENTYTMPLHLTNAANEHIASVLVAAAVDGVIPEYTEADVTRQEAIAPQTLMGTGNELADSLGTLMGPGPLLK